MVGFVSPAPPQRRDAWTALMPIEGRCFFIFSLATTPNIFKNQVQFSSNPSHISTNPAPLKQSQTECKKCTSQSVKIALFVECKCLIIQFFCMELLVSICSTYIMSIKPRIITKRLHCGIDGLAKFYYKNLFKQQSIV